MTLGTGYDGVEADLAARLSAQSDRRGAIQASRTIHASPSLQIQRGSDPSEGVNYTGGSSYTPMLPLPNANLAGILPKEREDIAKSNRYLKKQFGKSWPSKLHEGRISGGVVAPTVASIRSNINQGWNAAAQPGAAPGVQYGYTDMTLGPSQWTEAMLYSPAPLTQRLQAIRLGSSPWSVRLIDPNAKVKVVKELQKTDRQMQSLKNKVMSTKKATSSQKARWAALKNKKAHALRLLELIEQKRMNQLDRLKVR